MTQPDCLCIHLFHASLFAVAPVSVNTSMWLPLSFERLSVCLSACLSACLTICTMVDLSVSALVCLCVPQSVSATVPACLDSQSIAVGCLLIFKPTHSLYC